MSKKEEKNNKKLLVEGQNDLHVVSALCEKYQITENFDIIDCEGVENLIKQIGTRLKGYGVDTVGLIIDADTNLQSRWDSLYNTLTGLGFIVPKIFPKDGLIIENEAQKAGVWIMPNNDSDGILENFISFLIPKDDNLLPVVDDVLTEIEIQGLNKYPNKDKPKAKIHTWLAWQEEPGTPMGLSITKKYLSTDDVVCQQFVKWLIELFK